MLKHPRRSFSSCLLLSTGIAAFFGTTAAPSEVLNGPAAPNAQGSTGALACDDRLQAAFKPDAHTEVRLVHQFRKGDGLSLDGTPSGMTALADLCLVKLNIGPGNPGPAGAPSSSRGIGVEIWLPSPQNWNGRIHQLGAGGFSGIPTISSLTKLVIFGGFSPAMVSGSEGSVSAITDTGHVSPLMGPAASMDGSFAMNPDGTINTRLWKDFASRGDHEAALKIKALTALFYGRAATHAYFEGCSGGGREALSSAQLYPDDFDGILAGAPGINWTRVITADLYAQIVIQRDLDGKPLTPEQLDLVSSHAVSACDANLNGEHDGFISDPAQCRYDPSRDRDVLCKASGGLNDTSACVTRRQAMAINKMWYGQTVDGSAPNPKVSSGYAAKLDPGQVWFGIPRGAPLTSAGNFPITNGVAHSAGGVPMPFKIAAEQLALELQNPKMGPPEFHNDTGNGADEWMSLSYRDFARAQEEGTRLQPEFGYVNSDNPDLRGFRDHKAKMIQYQGTADQLLPIQGSINYYTRVAEKMGGFTEIQKFYKFYPIIGLNHCGFTNFVNGVAGVSPPAKQRLPEFEDARRQLYSTLIDWVEKGAEPPTLTLGNATRTDTRPFCAFPQKLKFKGGDRSAAASYVCQ
jgi:feruloyl esterase